MSKTTANKPKINQQGTGKLRDQNMSSKLLFTSLKNYLLEQRKENISRWGGEVTIPSPLCSFSNFTQETLQLRSLFCH